MPNTESYAMKTESPEIIRLPRPGERDPICQGSRTWLIGHNDSLPPEERFIFRILSKGKARGAVFINVEKLRTFMRKAMR